MTADVRGQLGDELQLVAERLAALAPDLHPLTNDRVRRSLAQAAEHAAMLICGDDVDDGIRAQAIIDVMNVLWPTSDPDPDWWSTPLGQACARSLGAASATSWTQSVAAAQLGVTVGTIKQLVHRGTLARHPDGGVVPADVLRYRDQRRR